jgi:S-adenosylmethionine:tRNA ribosyltransferase-isomerase
MRLEDYNYNLPESSIAQAPSNPKDSCKLMVLNKKGDIVHSKFSDLTSILKSGDILVLNNTKVKKAKIIGKKISGSNAEIILLHEVNKNKFEYEAKIKTKNPHIGTKIILNNGTAEIIEQKNIDTFVIRLSNKKVLDDAVLPTPPYIKKILGDEEYQTIFSKKEGSLAAPTAGLHFTKSLLDKLKKKGVKIVHITLHVSYGTFKNIDDIGNYVMDPEEYEISKNAAKIINSRKEDSRLFVCGTTTLKALETSSDKGKIISGSGASKLFIYPPFKFNSGTDALITNFHLPKSTLLLLTCAFGEKKRILKAYNAAVKNDYKFYSLGDAMIIFR